MEDASFPSAKMKKYAASRSAIDVGNFLSRSRSNLEINQDLKSLAGMRRWLIDIKKARRRIEDALRKTATEEEIIDIANLLKVKIENVQAEKCSRCGLIDYLACEDYPQGIFKKGSNMLRHRCRGGG